MAKAELIVKTGYDEETLMALALRIADQWAKNNRNNAEDSEEWDHYDALHEAFAAMCDEKTAAARA